MERVIVEAAIEWHKAREEYFALPRSPSPISINSCIERMGKAECALRDAVKAMNDV
jgi:hypothetical protein